MENKEHIFFLSDSMNYESAMMLLLTWYKMAWDWLPQMHT